MGLRTPHLTEQPPWLNAFLGQLLYAALAFIVIAIPFFVAGRLSAYDDLANAGLLTLASLGFMPALLGAVFWVLGNNADHARSEAGNPLPEAIAESIEHGAYTAAEVNELRKGQLRAHVNFVNRLARGMIAAGALWIVANLP
jgi:hypothetical protein